MKQETETLSKFEKFILSQPDCVITNNVQVCEDDNKRKELIELTD